MKPYTIKFQHNDSTIYPCACLIYEEEKTIALSCSVAKTWAEAEAEAVAKAKAQLNAGEPPQTKTVEI